MALFITFEGGEGSGKTVQSRSLYRRLTRLNVPAILVREPGSTPLGKKLARLLKWAKDTDISPMTELLMFNASRAQLVDEVIQPNLKAGKVIICDRYADSTTAYQSYGRGLDLDIVRTINNAAVRGIVPDLTVLLDITSEEGLTRKSLKSSDRFETQAIAFHRKVRDGYLKIAASEPERFLVVDATQSKEKIAQIIWERVRKLLVKGVG